MRDSKEKCKTIGFDYRGQFTTNLKQSAVADLQNPCKFIANYLVHKGIFELHISISTPTMLTKKSSLSSVKIKSPFKIKREFACRTLTIPPGRK